MATKDSKLHNGTILKNGTKLMVATHKSWDESIYPSLPRFDGYRFLRIRQKRQETV